MIASLKGTLTSIGKSDIILEVNDVGYFLNVSSKLISSLGDLGSNLFLYTDLQIKDDKIIMYGFATFKDQNFFKLLQSVQGVGPRAALSILSTLNVDEIILAISSGDKAMIARADGVGPKVAGRITTELLDKISTFNTNKSQEIINNQKSDKLVKQLDLENNNNQDDYENIVEDIISALVNLGFGRSEVFTVVMKIKKDFSINKKNKEFTVNNIVPLALKELSR
ncbi:MAG: Holliday junction branch migration protein RuvA [Alphaproteobacteria bacterium]|jgi:Holliday junction DNA helicase RuvA|nr:Holliday junction branch migration protein RuvA [Alphaproteobacteria bacterium]|tara:strand:- start:665 stop:1336 length:672 start_codon:yes stop_codon:yes gene_type:complete